MKEPKQLPILELHNGVQLFSTDAAVKYLLPDEEPVGMRDKWLEFSSERLAPAFAHNMVQGQRVTDPNAWPVLNAFVKKLDDALKGSPFLTGPKLTSADIAVWSLLAPEGTLKGAQEIDALLKWYKTIAAVPEVQVSLFFKF